ncbi:MAG: hypothetical protein LBJ63_04870 [Prevotellaceae bacterium]|nr:hypothetical protein [Prevotellaceae bacterium]
MALTGFQKICQKVTSGIIQIGLIEVADFDSATLDETPSDNYNTIELATGKKFKKYQFQENEAEFQENAAAENNIISFTKNLIFKLDVMSNDSRAAVSEIADASTCGLIAVIKRPGQKVMLIGYTEEEKKERPLKLSATTGTTGKAPSDAQGEEITLTCISAEKSRYYIGDFDALF